MSYYFELDRMRRILRACVEGISGDDEATKFRAETTKLLSDIRPSALIVDLSGTKKYDISSARIGAFARSASPSPSTSVPVIVVAPADHMFGTTRMFQIISDEKRPWFRVVRSSDQAYKLLGLDSPSFESLRVGSDDRNK